MTDQPTKDELRTLLRAASTGDQNAWRQIVHAYTPRVFSLIRSHCGDADLSEEITQSTFCTIAVKIGQYDELGKFEQWLFRIAMNRLRDEMRRRKRQANPVEHDTLTALIGAGKRSDNDDSDVDPVLRQALREAMQQLSDADQQIIYLRHCAELSFKRIAETLEQPLGTVLARQHRALKKLRELLERHEQDPPEQ